MRSSQSPARVEKLTTSDLYLDHPSGAVVLTDWVEDVGCGMFPAFWMDDPANKCIAVSSSVLSLVKHSGRFLEDETFAPDYLKMPFYWDRLTTADKRITRLAAFEFRGRTSFWSTFAPETRRIGRQRFISQSIKYLTEWVHYVESKFSDSDHILFVGGRDSRIIFLIPKLKPERWHVFSSEPNADIVKAWMDKNGLVHGQFFRCTNDNDDGNEYLLKKIVASDYRTNPHHLRWPRTIDSIAEKFGRKAVFWLGNAGDTLNACRDIVMTRNNFKDYWTWQYKTTASLQGGYHKMATNLTGCPCISGYSAPRAWEKVYQQFDPSEFLNDDLRPEIGDALAGRKLDWSGENPVPMAWFLPKTAHMTMRENYIAEIDKVLRVD